MSSAPRFDVLGRFADLERLVSKIYFRFSHLFMGQPDLRDFWWEMAREEEQHACILIACKALIENFQETLDPEISRDKAQQLETWLIAFLQRGTPSLTTEEAFRIALEIESSEIDTIYSKLIHLGGPHIAQTMETLGVPASIQRQKLKHALRRFCSSPELLQAAEKL
jgi:hypothetical protein